MRYYQHVLFNGVSENRIEHSNSSFSRSASTTWAVCPTTARSEQVFSGNRCMN